MPCQSPAVSAIVGVICEADPGMKQHEENFDADAAVVWRLGAELFTDSTQALLELIKNSYDADATNVDVQIDQELETDDLVGRIRIADDGHGMTEDAIRAGWLVISASAKREQKVKGITTKRHHRMPLGDKGLGRLGAQLLGQRLNLHTRPSEPLGTDPTLEHDVLINFEEFVEGKRLTSIKPTWTTKTGSELSHDWPGPRCWGTVIDVEGIRGDRSWITEAELSRRLSVIINPFREIEKFRLRVTLDGGDPLDLTRIGNQVREAALARWVVRYDGKHLAVRGRLRSNWFSTRYPERTERLQKELRLDSGRRALAERIAARGPMRPFEVRVASPPWALEITRNYRVPEDLEGLPGLDPGPFEMELDVVSLQFGVVGGALQGVFDRQSEYRSWLRDRIGVSVYRDGFVVASGFDLLKLGQAFTSGGSYYGLRPQNVMGYVAVTARDNPQLEETTNREAFRQNAAFQRFNALLTESRDAINRVTDEAGRAAAEFAADLAQTDQGLFGLTTDEVVSTADTLAQDASTASLAIEQIERVLTAVQSTARAALTETTAAEIDEALGGIKEARHLISRAQQLAPVAAHLRERIERLEDQYDELIATAGLGIAAEGLAHDLTAVVSRISDRAAKARAAIKGQKAASQVELLIEDVRWAAGALRSQLRHLDPMLRSARLRRELVDLGEVVAAVVGYHRERLADKGIEVRVHRHDPVTVRLSPGRLSQVLDNLMLNSEYWLTTESLTGAPRIDVTVEGDRIVVADNGPGVDEELGDRIFEAFVTQRHEGRGLGLWLSRQLLDADGAVIRLERDEHTNRLASFVIEYPTQ